jgi:serine protease
VRAGAPLRLVAALTAAAIAVLLATGTAVAAPFLPNDAGTLDGDGGWSAQQWNFVGPYGVNAPGAWANLIAARAPGGQGVTIAVLDTGVAYRDSPPFRRSPDLRSAGFVRGYDFVGDDPYPVDLNGHGTHVASTIAEATNNAYGLTGLAYGARIMPVRVLDRAGDGDPNVIAQGVRFAAAHGAKIINLSLNFAASVTAAQIAPLLAAINDAWRRGSLVVAAAGNASLPMIDLPARASHVLAVGATTENGCLASYSNRGPGLDVVAPGGGDDAALDDDPGCVAGRTGRAISQVTLDGWRPDRFGVRDYSGTSMAAPHVSAAAALVVASGVLGADPSPMAITGRLQQTARDLGAPGYDPRYGWGLIDAAAATTLGETLVPGGAGR